MKYRIRKKYYRRRKVIKKRPIFKNRIFWLFFIIISLSILTIYWLVFSSSFQIKNIEVKNLSRSNSKLDSKIRAIIEQNQETNLWLWKSNSILLFNPQQIIKHILESIPKVKEVNIVKKIPHSIIVNYQERKPVALWHQINDPEHYFLIDKNAVLFQEAVSTTEGTIIGTQDKFNKLGQKVLDKSYLAILLDSRNKIEQSTKEKVRELIVNSLNYVVAKMSGGWSIYLNPQNDIDWQITELRTVIEKKITPNKLDKLKYIDLRFNKVFISPNFEH